MRFLLLFMLLFVFSGLYSQFHDKNIPKINTLEAAQEYANRYRDVSFGIVNSELDVFLFDDVDITNLRASIGKISTIYKRRTKFLKDTSITMLNVQVIEFDNNQISIDSANVLMDSIIKKFESGVSYWSLMKEFMNSSCKFTGGPISTDLLMKRFGISMEDKKKDEIIKWSYSNRPNLPCLIIIHEEAHPVPAFYSISYNVAG